jgi:hypothetical protein
MRLLWLASYPSKDHGPSRLIDKNVIRPFRPPQRGVNYPWFDQLKPFEESLNLNSRAHPGGDALPLVEALHLPDWFLWSAFVSAGRPKTVPLRAG